MAKNLKRALSFLFSVVLVISLGLTAFAAATNWIHIFGVPDDVTAVSIIMNNGEPLPCTEKSEFWLSPDFKEYKTTDIVSINITSPSGTTVLSVVQFKQTYTGTDAFYAQLGQEGGGTLNIDIMAANPAPTTYTVTYYVDDVLVYSDGNIASGSSATLWTGYAAPAGYTFSGWNKTAADLTNITSDIRVDGTTTANPVYYAVTYYVDNNLIHTDSNILSGSSATLWTGYTAPTGYSFSGWNKTAADLANITSNIRVDGTTTQIQPNTYTVTYYVDNTLVRTESNIPSGGSSTLWTGYAAPSGYTFSGWNKTAEDLTNITSNIRVDGYTTANPVYYTITYYVNNELIRTDSNILSGTTATLWTGYTAPSGYTFSGWNKTAEDLTNVTTNIRVDGYTTANPVYYTVTYYVNNELVRTDSNILSGTTATLWSGYAAPSGYTFSGWNKTATDLINITSNIRVDGSTTLIQPNTYTVTYYVNNALVHTDSNILSGGSATLWAGYAAPSGYTFSGWNKTADDLTNITTNIRVEGTISPINQPIYFTVTYYVDNILVHTDNNIPYGGTATLWDGYKPSEGITFNGWNKDATDLIGITADIRVDGTTASVEGDSDKADDTDDADVPTAGVAGDSDKLPQTGGISTTTLLGLLGLVLVTSGGTIFVLGRKKADEK